MRHNNLSEDACTNDENHRKMKYFWYTYHDLPAGVGFTYFDGKHLTALGLTAAGIILFCLLYRNMSGKGQVRMQRAVALLTALGELAKDLFLVCIGRMGMEYLPLHLCSLAIAVYLIQAYIPDSPLRSALGEISYCLLLPGSISALLFPNWTAYPMMTFMSLHSFLWHALLVLYPILLLISGTIRPTLRHWWYPVVFLLIVTPPVYLFDVMTGTNYMFVLYPLSGTPLEVLYNLMGAWWRIGYALGVLAVILIMLAGAEIGYLIRSDHVKTISSSAQH